jgi:glycerophosphoryl diester phosphodiesterase
MRLTVTFLLLPVLAVAVRVFMAVRGEKAFSDAEICRFFVSVPGIIVLGIVGLLWCVVAFVEQAALMVIGYGAVEGRRLSWIGALRYVGSKLGAILPLGLQLLVRLMMVLVPFILGAVLVIHIALGEYHNFFPRHDIYYFLSYRPRGLGWAVVTVICLLGMMLFLASFKIVSWLLAIPAVLFENLGPVAAINDSIEDSKGHRWQLAGLLTLWIAVAGMFAVVGTFLIGMAGRSVLSLTGDSPALITFVIGATGCVGLVFYALVSFFAMALFAFSAVRVYRHCSGPGEMLAIAGEKDLDQRTGISIPGEEVLLAVAGVMVIAGFAAFALISELENPVERVPIIAHKGASAEAPENTLGAVEKAIEKRADYVEIDVQLTKDLVVVLSHDVVINMSMKRDRSWVAKFDVDGIGLKKEDGEVVRSENQKITVIKKPGGKEIEVKEGEEWVYINDLNFEELERIDVGSWWVEKKRFESRYRGARIPTLAQVLAACRGRKLKLMIELKYAGKHDQPELAGLVAEEVRRHRMQDAVVVMSFNAARLAEMRRLEPEWSYGQLFEFQPAGADILEGVDFIGLQKLGASRRLLGLARRRGIDVYVYTLNDPFGISAMLTRGVDGLITDKPELARGVLEFREGLNPLQRLLVGVGAEIGMFSIFL